MDTQGSDPSWCPAQGSPCSLPLLAPGKQLIPRLGASKPAQVCPRADFPALRTLRDSQVFRWGQYSVSLGTNSTDLGSPWPQGSSHPGSARVLPQLPPWPLCPREGTGTGTHLGSAQENPAASGITENPSRQGQTTHRRAKVSDPFHAHFSCLQNCAPAEIEKQHLQTHPIPEEPEVAKKQICKKFLFFFFFFPFAC